MNLPVKQGAYNLLEENWIPVLYTNGTTGRIGIWHALAEAGKIRQLAASNPMDRVSLLRFLLAVLMWCKEDAKSSLEALNKKNTDIPEEWLDKLKNNKDAFNLLGDGKRFYQTKPEKEEPIYSESEKEKPVCILLYEFPGEESVNHMRHVVYDNKSYGFCPACCAMGILRFSVWAPANRYFSASVNPSSAAYALIEGKNLFQILCVNLPETNPQFEQAPWLSDKKPDSPDAVAMLAWRPRKLWLNVAENVGPCEYCGQTETLIKTLHFKTGWPTPVTTGTQGNEMTIKKLTKNPTKEERSQIDPQYTQNKKFWHEDPHLLKDREPISLPELKSDVAVHSSRFWRNALRLHQRKDQKVTAVGPVVKKFIFHDCVSIDLPPASDDVIKRADLSKNCSEKLPEMIKPSHPAINTFAKLFIPHTEVQVRDWLSRINASAGDHATEDKAFLLEIYRPVVEQIVASITPGSPLRRRNALNHARDLMDKEIEKLVKNSNQPSNEDTTATAQVKQKRSRKKEIKT